MVKPADIERTSIYTTITSALEHNSDILLVNSSSLEGIERLLPSPEHRSSQVGAVLKLDYALAPRNGIYDVKELQQCLDTLVPSLKPIETVPFRIDDSHLHCGRLYFIEKVGTERTIIQYITTSPTMVRDAASRQTEASIKNIYWAISVSLYPDEKIALSPYVHSVTLSRIPLSGLKYMKPRTTGLFERLRKWG